MFAFQGTGLRTKKILAVAVLTAQFSASAFAADTTYTGAATGTWNVAGNWNGGVPTNTSTTIIDNRPGTNVNLFVTSSEITGTLNISAGDRVTLSNGSLLRINPSGAASGVLNNAGTILINSTANQTQLQMQDGGTISGGGTITLKGFGPPFTSNAILGGGGPAIPFVNLNNYIHGEGNIGGFANSRFDNRGTVVADVNGGSLEISTADSGALPAFVNSGNLRAVNGGTLFINGGNPGRLINTGTIQAQNNSEVQLRFGIDVSGGTITTSGTGSVSVTGTTGAQFTGVTNTGLMVCASGAPFYVKTSFINNGSINVESGTSTTGFFITDNATLSGNGQLILDNTAASVAGAAGMRLTNATGHTIRGQGNIGQGSILVTNQSLIISDLLGGTIAISPNASAGSTSFINSGTLRAANGGFLQLNGGGGYTNTGGLIEAQNGSRVRFSGSDVRGGTLNSIGTGSLLADNGAKFTDLTNNGLLLGTLDIAGTIINNGTIRIDGGGTLLVNNDVTLNGTGQVILNGSFIPITGTDDRRLTNGPNHTIRGQGLIGQSVIFVTNDGTITADVNGASIQLSGDITGGANAFINNGVIRAANGGRIQFGPSESEFSGLGSVVADTNSNVQAVSGVTVNQGSVSGAGTFSAFGGSIFTATNYRVGGVVVNAATTRIRAGGGTLGTSKVNSLSLVGAARMDVNDSDLIIDYTGASPINSIRPQIATAFGTGSWTGVGITSSAAGAAAATTDKTGLGYVEATDILTSFPAVFRGQSVDATSVLIGYTLLGDANLDRTVNITDFARLAANFNTPSVWFNGDFNYDGNTNISDFALLAANFNKNLPADLPRGAAVPEASSLALLGLAAALKCHHRQRRN